MIKIKLFTYSTCEELLNYKTDMAVRELYNNTAFDYKGSGFIADTVTLDITHKELGMLANPGDDLANSMKIFSALKHLDPVQANDKRLWVTLTHTVFFNYARERWGIDQTSSNDVIKDRFHFEGAGLRARNQNSLARLWWAAKITHDENRTDPFELTKLLWEKQDFYQNLIDRKFSTYKGALNGFLKFYASNKHLDLKKDMRKLFKGINAYGGVRVLSLMSEDDVNNQLRKLCDFYKIKIAV